MFVFQGFPQGRVSLYTAIFHKVALGNDGYYFVLCTSSSSTSRQRQCTIPTMPVWTMKTAAKACSCWSYIVVRRMLQEWFIASRLHLALSSAPFSKAKGTTKRDRRLNNNQLHARVIMGANRRTTRVLYKNCTGDMIGLLLCVPSRWFELLHTLEGWTHEQNCSKAVYPDKCTPSLPLVHPCIWLL